MPFLIPFIPVILGGLVSAAVPGLTGAVLAAVVTVGAGLAVAKLAPKEKGVAQQQTADQAVASRNFTVRSATEPHRIIVGDSGMLSGLLSYAEVTGTGTWDQAYLWLVITFAAHEVTSIDEISYDDFIIPPGGIDVAGNVLFGKFQGLTRIKKYLGTPNDLADPLLLADTVNAAWTSNHRQRGRAHVYFRLHNDDTAYQSGMPVIKARLRGWACFDPRDGATRYTTNPALILRKYLIFRLGLTTAEVPDADVIAAANICDERVAMPTYTSPGIILKPSGDTFDFTAPENRIGTGDGFRITTSGSLSGTGFSIGVTYYMIRQPQGHRIAGSYVSAIAGQWMDVLGTGTGQHQLQHIDHARYTCNGFFALEPDWRPAATAILATMVGTLVYVQGAYRMFAGAYSTPTVTLTANDLRGEIEYAPEPEDLFNTLRVKYFDSFLNDQLTDAPEVTSTQFIADDGGEKRTRDIEFLLVNNVMRAQRIASIELHRARAPRLRMPCKLTALQLAYWDTVMVTLPQLGLSSAVFRVIGWELVVSADDMGVNLNLQADSPAYWAAFNGTQLTPRGALNIPGDVLPPTDVRVLQAEIRIIRQAPYVVSSFASETVFGSDGLLWGMNPNSNHEPIRRIDPSTGLDISVWTLPTEWSYRLCVAGPGGVFWGIAAHPGAGARSARFEPSAQTATFVRNLANSADEIPMRQPAPIGSDLLFMQVPPSTTSAFPARISGTAVRTTVIGADVGSANRIWSNIINPREFGYGATDGTYYYPVCELDSSVGRYVLLRFNAATLALVSSHNAPTAGNAGNVIYHAGKLYIATTANEVHRWDAASMTHELTLPCVGRWLCLVDSATLVTSSSTAPNMTVVNVATFTVANTLISPYPEGGLGPYCRDFSSARAIQVHTAGPTGTWTLYELGSYGSTAGRILVSWTRPASPNVSGFEVSWKGAADAVYSSATLPPEASSYYITGVQAGLYDIRVRTIGPGAGRSAWVSIAHTVN